MLSSRPRSECTCHRCCRLNYDRYHSWSDQLVVPAVLAFDGPAYKGLQAEDMDDASLRYLQGHLRILCGLYGVLRPLDALKPYRYADACQAVVNVHHSVPDGGPSILAR